MVEFVQAVRNILVYFPLVHPYSSIDMVTAWKKKPVFIFLFFILLYRADFHKIDYLSIAVHIFTRQMLISLSVDEILLPRYLNLSTNFRGLPLRVEKVSSRLKHVYYVLFAFM